MPASFVESGRRFLLPCSQCNDSRHPGLFPAWACGHGYRFSIVSAPGFGRSATIAFSGACTGFAAHNSSLLRDFTAFGDRPEDRLTRRVNCRAVGQTRCRRRSSRRESGGPDRRRRRSGWLAGSGFGRGRLRRLRLLRRKRASSSYELDLSVHHFLWPSKRTSSSPPE